MAAQHSLHVALTKPLVSFVEEQVATGHYATASEVVRAALRMLIERVNVEPPTATSADQAPHG